MNIFFFRKEVAERRNKLGFDFFAKMKIIYLSILRFEATHSSTMPLEQLIETHRVLSVRWFLKKSLLKLTFSKEKRPLKIEFDLKIGNYRFLKY